MSSKTATDVDLPWGAWYQDAQRRLSLPQHWQVDVLAPQVASDCSTEEILRAIDSPVGSPPLAELAAKCRSACVVVDDLARPTRAADILPPVLERLEQAGIPRDAVRIVVATGSHGPLDDKGIAWKVGDDVAALYRVESHDCRKGLAETGILFGDEPLQLNRTFLEADLKIAIGSVLPHSFAAYSGGAKMVLPGLASLSATARSHKFVLLGLWKGSSPDENRFRREAERIAGHVGLNFVVCVLCGPNRETAGVVAGDVVAAHRKASSAARELYRTKLKHDYDCLVLNAYPKDVDLVQAENVFVALKTTKRPAVREGGVVVLTTAASEGLGRHGLFEPGGESYRRPTKKRALGKRDLWLFTPNLATEEVHKLFWDGYPVFHDARRLTETLAERFPNDTRAAVLPCAPMQQIDDLRPVPLEASA